MNILFTTFTYYPETSGVSVAVQTLTEGMAAKGHNVTVVSSNYGKKLPSESICNNVKIIRKNFSVNLFKKYVGDVNGYIDFVVNYPKDVLVLECIQCYTTDILLSRLKDMNCKIILHSHGGPGLHDKPFAWEGDIIHTIGHTHNWCRWKKYYKYTLPSAAKYIDVALCLSLCASDLAFMNKTMKRVELLENAANSIFFNEELYKKDISKIVQIRNDDYVLCIANYIPNKRQDDIIKAFAKIHNEKCSLVMVGSKKNKFFEKLDRLSKKVNRENGKEIILLTGVERSYFPSLIHNSKLFVMASKHEEYPVSLVEAMACGTPFVSTNAGCSRLLPGGVTVVNRSELAVFMDMVESHEDIREYLSKQGRRYACEHNTTKLYIDKFEDILYSIQ